MTKTPITDALKSILSSEDKWTRHTRARDKDGNRVEPTDPSAIRFCLQGACSKVAITLPINALRKPYELINKALNHSIVMTHYNDSIAGSFQDIQDVLNKAAEIEAKENA
jgi:hypothetical protein